MANRPNILLMVSEDNGQHLSCYGDENIQTPNIDKLAEEGVRFENGYTTQSVCSPGRASLLTGLYPHQNGQFGLATHKYALYDDFPNMQSLLKSAGYRTGMLGKLHINPENLFPLDLWWNARESISFAHRDVVKTADMANDFMGASDEPFLLMVNFSDAHLPFIKQDFGVPEHPLEADDVMPLPQVGIDTQRIREHTADYYNCMLRLDTCVGLVLEKLETLGKAENTLVIFTTDHGAQFSRGKTSIYEGGLRVPLMMRWPGWIASEQVRPELMSHIDILPTVLEAIGEPVPDGLPGLSALSLLSGKKAAREHLFAEWCAGGPASYFPQRSVRDSRFKLIWNMLQDRSNPGAVGYSGPEQRWAPGANADEITRADEVVRKAYGRYENPPEFELFDLADDPWEWIDLSENPEFVDVLAGLRDRLNVWQVETQDALRVPENLRKLTQKHDEIVGQFYQGDAWGNSRDYDWEYTEYLYQI
ncbi:MAG: sulfatase [Candidatus Latescibacteria bacterium]|nr:sulfatase [Candidatus Latescibacterota bacterium]MBT5830120.1 sulfatase [Candidatus Latescibacterota bacterium]